ncbi:alpha/beta fold hydrolase [Desulfomicrobium escambiense]|uniref:alpha/beta fold hydrolase n=1 Tax=Desulfomicrobium escambiense TaxID=29503 RepID=UPI000404F758|nr:alpha/beta hydrolase [Desulfomicrobium escambiense]
MERESVFTAADGARIAYRITRAGAPRRTLVLLHGVASNMTRWWNFVGGTSLAQGWDILRLDLRGHGGSLCRGRVGMDVWSADLAALLRHEGVEQAEVVGHCLGANLALWFAWLHPDLVSGLVLIEPMFRAAITGQMTRVLHLRPVLAAMVRPLLALAARGVHRGSLPPLDLAELDRLAHEAMARTNGAFPTKRFSSPMHELRILPTVVYLQDLLAVTDPLPDLSAVRAPALALLSSGGIFGDPGMTVRCLEALPDCRIEHLDAVHWIPTEQPLAMREAIERWCGRHG